MAKHVLRLKVVNPEELLSEERVLQKDPDNPFFGPGDHPEPYRTGIIAYARLEPVFKKEPGFRYIEEVYGEEIEREFRPPLIVNTPRGRGLLWRLWETSIGVVLMKQRRNEWVLEDTVTFLEPHEQKQLTVNFTAIVLNPPTWALPRGLLKMLQNNKKEL